MGHIFGRRVHQNISGEISNGILVFSHRINELQVIPSKSKMTKKRSTKSSHHKHRRRNTAVKNYFMCDDILLTATIH